MRRKRRNHSALFKAKAKAAVAAASGSVPLRSYLCEVRRSGRAESTPGPGPALR